MVGASEALGGGVWAAVPTLWFGGGNSAAPGLFGSKSGRVLPSSSMIHRGEKSRVRDLASYPQREPSVGLQGKPILRDRVSIYPVQSGHKWLVAPEYGRVRASETALGVRVSRCLRPERSVRG